MFNDKMKDINEIAKALNLDWPNPYYFSSMISNTKMPIRSGRTTIEILKAIKAIYNKNKDIIYIKSHSADYSKQIADILENYLSILHINNVKIYPKYSYIFCITKNVYILCDHTYYEEYGTDTEEIERWYII